MHVSKKTAAAAIVISVIAVAAIVLAVGASRPDKPVAVPVVPSPAPSRQAIDQILVKYRAGADQESLRLFFAQLGAEEVEEIANLRVKILRIEPSRRDEVIAKLRANPSIEYAEADSAEYYDDGATNDR